MVSKTEFLFIGSVSLFSIHPSILLSLSPLLLVFIPFAVPVQYCENSHLRIQYDPGLNGYIVVFGFLMLLRSHPPIQAQSYCEL